MEKDSSTLEPETTNDSDADLIADAVTELRAMDLPSLADAVERAISRGCA